MPYVQRDGAGQLLALRSELPADPAEAREWEAIDPAAAELQQFALRQLAADNPFLGSDLDFIRVLDDLIELLLGRGLIMFTELPVAAQRKLLERRRARDELRGLELIEDDSDELLI